MRFTDTVRDTVREPKEEKREDIGAERKSVPEEPLGRGAIPKQFQQG